MWRNQGLKTDSYLKPSILSDLFSPQFFVFEAIHHIIGVSQMALVVKNPPTKRKRLEFDLWVRKIP